MRILAMVVVGTLLLSGCFGGSSKEHPAPDIDPATGQPMIGPDWTFVDTAGVTQNRDGALGAPAGIFFMAVWCSKCAALAPRLAAIEDEYAGQGFQMYSVSWDPQAKADQLNEWKSKYNNDWPHGVDSRSKMSQTFDITSQSSLVILDASGNPVKTWIFENPSAASLREAIDEAFARSAPAA